MDTTNNEKTILGHPRGLVILFFAEMWERFRFSQDVEARKAAYAELMDRIKQDPPVLPLYRPYESWGMQKSVNWAPQPGHIPYVLDFRAGSISLADS